MPHATQVTSLVIEPMVHDPKETKVDFGATVSGVDLNDVDSETFAKIKEAVLTHRLLVFKGQEKLHPANQLKFVQMFSPGSTHFSHALDPDYAKRRGNGGATIPGTPQCQVLGYGPIPDDHYGLPNGLVIDRQDHRKMHKFPLSEEELAKGDTRLMQLHFDGSLYSVPPPFCGSLLAVRTPKGPDLTLRFDNVNGKGEKKMAPGSTAYFNAAMAYKLLTPEQQEIANHSSVTYAPHAFTWIATTKFTSDGSSIITEGKEVPLEDLPPYDEDKIQTLPMVWHNPLNGEKSLMIHGQVAMRVNVKTSPDSPVKVLEDLGEVRAFLQTYQTPILMPEYVYCHNHQEGDLAVWYNHGMWHSITEFPTSCGPRIMHQCNLGHNEEPK
ncbi:alpha-ketoglutarate dependent xanthine dioxygenase [Leucosporidium creatinivorum]|uniref:Alpha-ketoglutarate dependent xanthine dioxygenase n=1 Tax=Leucosporidium creatinivorum TaxID=106004 RepID=A0A1Y2DXG8_9BASI|nr:alpha-ketoglutarate dependent xanthine dioxygenase [Leucosporidium creatinivorum]